MVQRHEAMNNSAAKLIILAIFMSAHPIEAKAEEDVIPSLKEVVGIEHLPKQYHEELLLKKGVIHNPVPAS